ncbi:aldo/keto reductase [Gallaecimonas sp. GXIMD4217]|uniref:aldo/keto reductase n=1 Tax=Gallaecimonas sp. GXIMD4217 TaxID=3131927 RepID=UPI00311B249A
MAGKSRAIDKLVAGFWRLNDWGLGSLECANFIAQCIEAGVTAVDHADIYGGHTCEARFGEALKQAPELREQLTLITKCGIVLQQGVRAVPGQVNHYNSSRAHIIASAQQSLKNLATDRLDVLLIHRPDYLMDADEVAEAFNTLRRNGDVLAFGVSNFTPAQFSLLQSRLDFPLITNQIECSPYEMKALDDGTLDQCQQLGIHPMLWSPLAGGRLFNQGDAKAHRLRQALSEIGEEIGARGLDQVVYAWLNQHPSRPSIVLGTGKIERIHAAVAAQHLTMTREQWYRIWQASKGHAVP